MLAEVGDLAGQHEVVAEQLTASVLSDVTAAARELKDERKRVSGPTAAALEPTGRPLPKSAGEACDKPRTWRRGRLGAAKIDGPRLPVGLSAGMITGRG